MSGWNKPSLRGAEATKQSRAAGIERWIASLALAMTQVVMAGLVPAIHALLSAHEDVDARHKAGHDGKSVSSLPDLIRQSMRPARQHGPPGQARW
jgi:hypothetical protein